MKPTPANKPAQHALSRIFQILPDQQLFDTSERIRTLTLFSSGLSERSVSVEAMLTLAGAKSRPKTRFGKSLPPKYAASDRAHAGHYVHVHVHVKIAWVFTLFRFSGCFSIVTREVDSSEPAALHSKSQAGKSSDLVSCPRSLHVCSIFQVWTWSPSNI